METLKNVVPKRFQTRGFDHTPPRKNLKWGEICSYLASQAIYIGTGLENDSQHG